MQTVILAAGKGTRFGEMTKNIPKCLLPVNKKPIIKYILESLPADESEIIVIIGYLGNKIKKYLGKKFRNHSIKYIEMGKIKGTAGALWSAKDLIKDKFLVLNSDDIISSREIKEIIRHCPAFGIIKKTAPSFKYLDVVLDEKNNIAGLKKIKEENILPKINVATGVYVLDRNIFKYKPVKIRNKSDEYGLPQTIIKIAKKFEIKGVFMPNALFINDKKQLKDASRKLKRAGRLF